jgi:hypothetical protein
MTTDPEVMSDPARKEKIHVHESSAGSETSSELPEGEVVRCAMKYLKYGAKCCYDKQWKGLSEVLR